MTDLAFAAFITFLLSASAASGSFLYRYLSEHHKSRSSMEFVQIVASLLTTFTALILSLLLTEVNSNFSKTDIDLRSFAASFISLDTEMAPFGPQAEKTRLMIEEYLRSVVIETWPEERRPTGAYMQADTSSNDNKVDAQNLGHLLLQSRTELRRLVPLNEEEQIAKTNCLSLIAEILSQRWKLIGEADATVSPSLLTMMVAWLAVVFASFGVTAPRHAFSAVWIGVVAISVGGAIFTILELDGPLDGLIRVSSEPIRHALYFYEHNHD